MPKIENVIYTGRTHITGGREGTGKSSDGQLDVKLSSPGSGKPGTNPEQLLGVGWAACFIGAIKKAGAKLKVAVPESLAVDAEVDLGSTGPEYFLAARLKVSLPGVDREVAQSLVNIADQTCPYSKALRGNVDVAITLV